MRARIVYAVLTFTLFTTSCFPKNGLAPQEASPISWDDLQVTPQTNSNLCTEISPKELDWESLKRDFTSGLFGGIYPEDPSNLKKLADGTLWVAANEQQSFLWRFWYPEGNDRSANLRLFILLDEHQLNNALPNSGMYNDINLESGDDIALRIIIPPLDAGTHDIIAIGIPYPEEYPNEYGVVNLVYWRITLIAEPISSPFRKLNFVSLPAEGSIKQRDPVMALELTLKNDGIDVWNWPNPWLDTTTGISTNLFALVGYQNVVNTDAPQMAPIETSFFSLLLFIDYQQTDIVSNQIALYNKVDKDTAYTRIPIQISPLPPGKHNLLVLRIDSPGVPMCILKGNPKGRIFPNSVSGKLVGINVLTSK